MNFNLYQEDNRAKCHKIIKATSTPLIVIKALNSKIFKTLIRAILINLHSNHICHKVRINLTKILLETPQLTSYLRIKAPFNQLINYSTIKDNHKTLYIKHSP